MNQSCLRGLLSVDTLLLNREYQNKINYELPTMTLNVHKENPITIQHINWYHFFPCPDKFV
jgi:hypothetical protein